MGRELARAGGKGILTHVACCIATANLPIAGHTQHIALSDMATGVVSRGLSNALVGMELLVGGRHLCRGGGTRPERAVRAREMRDAAIEW